MTITIDVDSQLGLTLAICQFVAKSMFVIPKDFDRESLIINIEKLHGDLKFRERWLKRLCLMEKRTGTGEIEG